MKVIGLVGEKGGGKGTVVEILKEVLGRDKIAVFTYSNLLAETLDYFNLPHTRANFQALATFLRSLNPRILAEKIESQINELPKQPRLFNELKFIVVDGIRKQAELSPVSKFNGKLIYVTASLEIRFERLKNRAEKQGEAFMTFEKFMA